jgi:exosortase/archaeosortase family protein
MSELARPSSLARGDRDLAIRVFIAVLCLVGAFHYSLFTLLRGLSLDSPLSYLGLVPAIAAVLALMLSRPSRSEPDVHDRYVDYIVGIPLLIISLAVMVIVSARLSTFFWLWRIDLLTLPLFVAGAVSLIFGFRTLWRIRFAVAFLWLAWPPPYTLLLDGWLEASTAATLAALGSLVQVIPVAQQLQGGDGSLFSVTHGAESFVLSVASACAGANSSLGFALVGLAFVGIASGGLIQKALWLTAGTILIWSLNLLRILVIFGAGRVWGETVAIETFHPFLGLVGFTVGLLVMVAASPIFGVRLPEANRAERLARSAPHESSRGRALVATRGRNVQRAAVPLAIVVGAALITGVVDAQMRSFELLAHDLGPPRIEASNIATANVGGWLGRRTASYPFVQQYFGKDANWDRYLFTRNQAGLVPAAAAFVTLDVISTSDLSSFSTYGLEACYGFHRYQILEAQRVELAGGVVGRSIVYENPKTGTRWSAVYWEWPVQIAGAQRYERVVLYLMQAPADASAVTSARGSAISRIQLALADALGGSVSGLAEPELVKTRDFLIAFASDLISATGAEKARTNEASSP